jgi:flagellar FliJ protein
MSSGLKWAGSLTRIANYEVETLQKRLGEVVERRLDAELRITLMDAEAEAEMENANADPMSAMYHPQFLKGWRVRRQQLDERMAQIAGRGAGRAGRAVSRLRGAEEVRARAGGLQDRREQGNRAARDPGAGRARPSGRLALSA